MATNIGVDTERHTVHGYEQSKAQTDIEKNGTKQIKKQTNIAPIGHTDRYTKDIEIHRYTKDIEIHRYTKDRDTKIYRRAFRHLHRQ